MPFAYHCDQESAKRPVNPWSPSVIMMMNDHAHSPRQNPPPQLSALSTLVSAPEPQMILDDQHRQLDQRAEKLPAKYRAAYNGIRTAERNAWDELRFNQEAKRVALVERERIDILRCMAAPTTAHPVERPVTEEMKQEATRAAEQWANGVEAGQRSVLDQYFYDMKKHDLDHAEKLHRTWQKTAQRALVAGATSIGRLAFTVP